MAAQRSRRTAQSMDMKRDGEWVAIERTIRAMVAEGKTVAGVWRPDMPHADPTRNQGRRPVDAAMLIDGRPAGLDVTGFWEADAGQAAVRASSWRVKLRERLDAAWGGGWLVVFLEYEPARLDRASAQRMDDALAPVAEVILREGARIDDNVAHPIDASAMPSWLVAGQVHRRDKDTDSVNVTVWPRRAADEFVATAERIRKRKGRQLEGWGLGIVVISPRGIHEELADVVEVFRRGAPWPFWRVYWNDASTAHLVWEGPAIER